MGMSAEDFGAVLAELEPNSDCASKLEKDAPQRTSTRWWFSIRAHAVGHFEAREYHDWKQRYDKSSLLLAETVWNQLQRPELRFWILDALGLFDDSETVYDKVLAKDTMAKRNTYLKNLFDWRKIEDKAREEYDRLVLKSELSHRPSS